MLRSVLRRTGLRRCLYLGAMATLLLTHSFQAPVAASASSVPDVTDGGELAAFFDDSVPRQLRERNIPGAVVVVVKDGQTVFAGGWGHADLDRGMAMDPERTLIRPGSASKPFVWTAVMQLAEQGRIDLNTDINEYLDFEIAETYEEPITMHHLLTHTAGFEAVEDDLFILDEAKVPSLAEYVRKHRPVRVFWPGTVTGYSNYGTALAAYIVERVSGESFSDYVENRIFTPLGMSRSTLRQPVPQHLAVDLAQGYGGTSEFVRGDFEYVGPYPAGSASMTAADMAKFMVAHLDASGSATSRVLRPETAALMHRQQFTPDPRLAKMAYGFAEMRSNGRRLLWHGGSTFLHSSALYLLPEENLGVFVAYNATSGAAGSTELIEAFLDEFYPGGDLAPLHPVAESKKRNSRYAGEYHFSRSEFTGGGKFLRLLSAAQVSAADDGRLLLTVEGASEPYIEVEDGTYRHEQRDEYLVFAVEDDGRMWVHSDGSPSHVAFFATSAFRAPWYETSGLVALILLSTAITFLVSSIGWGVAALVRKKERPSGRGRAERVLAGAFGALLWAFVLALVVAITNVDPAYGVPRAFLGEEPLLLTIAMWTPVVMMLLAAGMLVAAAIGSRSDASSGGMAAKAHYALLVLLAVSTSAILLYWNLNALAG